MFAEMEESSKKKASVGKDLALGLEVLSTVAATQAETNQRRRRESMKLQT